MALLAGETVSVVLKISGSTCLVISEIVAGRFEQKTGGRIYERVDERSDGRANECVFQQAKRDASGRVARGSRWMGDATSGRNSARAAARMYGCTGEGRAK